MTQQKACVIGAGVGGLATACRLAAKGYRVAVFEANDYPGGKLTAFEKDGYRFDAGPSLFTLPTQLDAVFERAGKNPRDYYQYQRIPVTCHYFYPDGERLKAYAEPEKFAKEVERVWGVPTQKVLDYLEHAKFTFESSGKIFLEKSLHKAKTYLSPEVASALLHTFQYDIFKSMHEANIKRMEHPKMAQLFDRFATYNGSNPYKAPGILNSIAHLEFNDGSYYSEGGIHTITMALFQLAQDLGVNFQFTSPVEEIVLEGKKAKGIKVAGEIIPADLVISNMDVYPTYHRLLKDKVKVPNRTLNQERSSSALIYYWGIRQSFPELDLHNIFFSNDYAKEFASIFEEHKIAENPTIYVNITSKYSPEDAPAGKENWFVMVNVPANQGQDWDTAIAKTREVVIKTLSKQLGSDIGALIETEELLDPRSIEAKTSSYQGALYGTSSNNRYAAFLRHPNFSRKVKNLFFCGGSVHPGGGIPLCLLSAKIIDDLVPTP